MAMSSGELYRCVRTSFEHDLFLTAGNNSAEIPVLRLVVIGDRASAVSVRKYDAVIYHEAHRKKCSVLDAAEALNAKGACAMVISSEEYGVYELEQLRSLCKSLSMPLVEIRYTDFFPSLINIINEKITGFYEDSLKISELLHSVIRIPELYGYYRKILSAHGFYEYSDYCVAVCHFVGKDSESDCRRNVANAARFIETGLDLKNASVSVLTMGYHVAVVFADVDTDNAVWALRRGLAAIPDDIISRYRIYIGVSDCARGIDCVSALLSLAAKTAMLQQRRGNEGCPVRYSEQNLNKFMMTLKDRDTIDSLINDTIYRLVEYDRHNGTDYIRYLRVYFRNNCLIQKTADELYIHRNSVTYAMRKIENIIGRNLSEINTKAELILGLGFMELSGDKPFSDDT